MGVSDIERLRVVPAAEKARQALSWHSRSAIRHYPEPDDFPPAVIVAMRVLTLLAAAALTVSFAHAAFVLAFGAGR